MRKDNSEFKTGFLSEAGTYLRNKDYFAFAELDDLACYVIADGLDSDIEVESAEMAVKCILGNFINKPTFSRFKISRYIQEAHQYLREESRRVRLKVSLTVVITNYSKVMWAVAGNTRLYHFRNGRLNWISKDQSLAQLLADRDDIPESNLDTHEERNNLLEYIGKPTYFQPYISKKYPLTDGDVMVLCTPGLWENVNRVEMLDAVEASKAPEDLVDTLEEVLLSKQKRLIPNYTVASIFANKTFQEDPKKKWKLIQKIAVAVFLFVLMGGGVYVYKAKSMALQAETAASIIEHENNGDTFIQDGDYPKALTEYSEARNASIKVKDKIHTALLTKKQRITQLIVDGDTSVKDGDYMKAVSKYQKALQEMKDRSDFNRQEIEAKISKTESFTQVAQWVKEGDVRFEAQDYEGAKEFYLKAKKAAVEVSFPGGEKDIRAKLDDVETKQTSVAKEIRQLDGEKFEKDGDQSIASQDYNSAIESYSMAQGVYQEIGLLEKVLGTERKKAKAEEELAKLSNPGNATPETASSSVTPVATGDAAVSAITQQEKGEKK